MTMQLITSKRPCMNHLAVLLSLMGEYGILLLQRKDNLVFAANAVSALDHQVADIIADSMSLASFFARPCRLTSPMELSRIS